MNTKFKKTIASGIIGITALSGAALALPGLAGAQDDVAETPDFVVPEADSRSDRLQGLVDDGTITQEQADAIAEHVSEHRGKKGRHGTRDLTPAADALGVTAEELQASLSAGDTLADVAAAQGVSIEALTDALVAAKNEKLAEKVADGSITQEQADTKAAQIEERVTARINGERPERGERDGKGRRGHHRGHRGLSGATNVIPEIGGLGA